MNTNHKPATALPWETDEWGSVFPVGKYDRVVLTGFSLSMGPRSQEAEQNTAYMLHTANAYPQMVQVLKDRAALPEGGPERALLTKLGEA